MASLTRSEGVIVGKVASCVDVNEKLKHLTLDIGSSAVINVVTNAPNVGTRTIGKLVIVAQAGVEIEGEIISKRNISGVLSEGMLMDCKTMGWSGGAVGNAVLVPDHFKPGDPAPGSRPRNDEEAALTGAPSEISSSKKAAKEEAKKAAKALRDAKKAAKAKGGKIEATESTETRAEVEDETDEHAD